MLQHPIRAYGQLEFRHQCSGCTEKTKKPGQNFILTNEIQNPLQIKKTKTSEMNFTKKNKQPF